MGKEKLKAGESSGVPHSAFEEGNPDFAPERDCPEARGACYLQDVMAAEKPKSNQQKKND